MLKIASLGAELVASLRTYDIACASVVGHGHSLLVQKPQQMRGSRLVALSRCSGQQMTGRRRVWVSSPNLYERISQ